MSGERSVLGIDVYSDVICPWCYVGKRRLERALKQVGDKVNAEVTWRPFQLNPTMPQQGMNRTVYL
ncbi:MAG: DsbA family protein, partial [Nitrospira sp.]